MVVITDAASFPFIKSAFIYLCITFELTGLFIQSRAKRRGV
jgi:hypothetical protein